MRSVVILLLTGVFLFSCKSQKGNKSSIPYKSPIYGLATPFQLTGEKSELILQDYFSNPRLIDSISVPKNLITSFSKDTSKLGIFIKEENQLSPLTEIQCWIDGTPYSILLKKSRKIQHRFQFDPKGQKYTTVKVAGNFNDWNPNNTLLRLNRGKWQASLPMNPGAYQYQIVADDQWMLDPANPDSVDNNIGGFNSLLVVGKKNNNLIPQLFTKSFNEKNITLGINGKAQKVIALWQNEKLKIKNTGSEIVIEIPKVATSLKRSFIRVFAHNSHGASNDLLLPLEKGKLIQSSTQLNRQDKHANILYFMMVDRFNNGNKNNDQKVRDAEIEERANYYGGDLAGITQKIQDDYFSNLNINTIWLSPITQNPEEGFIEYPQPRRKYSGYHGYWPISYTEIDHRFGTDAELKELVEAAHSKGINVLLDFVSNHVHEQNPMIQENPDWKTNLYLEDSTINIRLWDEQRLTTWFDTFLPSLDFSQEEVIETVTDSALFWIQEYNLDGFRHDATKHIPETYWRNLTTKLKQEVMLTKQKDLYQIGETFGSRELIGSYVNSGQLDGQFDFNLYFDARAVFAIDQESFIRLNQSLQESFEYYGHHSLMGNISNNHDMPRFIAYASGDLRFDEDPKEAGWNRKIEVSDPVGYQKLSSLIAFTMTIPGVPVLYYGDEIGMTGANDPDNRRPMRFNNWNDNEQKVHKNVQKLAELRRNNLAFIYGDFKVLEVTKDVYIYSRSYFDNHTIVLFNKSNKAQKMRINIDASLKGKTLKSHFNGTIEKSGSTLGIQLPPNSFEVLVSP